MKIGKVSNTVLKRSVLKNISSLYNQYIPEKNNVGLDGSLIQMNNSGQLVMATDCGIEPVYTVANNICVKGGKPVCIQCSIVMPANYREIRLREIMENITEDCRTLGLAVAGGHTQVSAAVTEPIISVTGIGIMETDNTDGEPVWQCGADKAMPNEDIIVTKWIGIGGAHKIVTDRKKELLSRYQMDFLARVVGDREDLSIAREAEAARKAGVRCMHDVSQGGIFAALWDMAEASGVGINADLRKIPVKQEIIEVCEMYDINPYQLQSGGCLLMTFADGYGIVNILASVGIHACVIGRTTSGNDKIIHNLDEIRYLDLPKQDSLYADWKGNIYNERKNLELT